LRFDLAEDNINEFFGKPLSEWSNLQLTFVRWCKFYHDIFSISDENEPPSLNIIDNDILLDQWVQNRKLAKHQNTIKNRGNGIQTEDGFVKYKPGGGRVTRQVFHPK